MSSTDSTPFKKIVGMQTENGQPVPLKAISVEVKIQGYIAEVESSLQYRNEEGVPIEAKFTFPVDDGSAVFKFEAFIEEKHILAEMQAKEEAKMTYQDAITKGRTAMLLQEDDSSRDIFQCMLGNLPPHSDATLKMSYVIELPQEPDGRLRFTLPTVLNPRYSPDAGGEVAAEGATYVPSSQIPYKFDMSASVSGYHAVKSVKSDKIQLNVQSQDNKKLTKVTLKDEFKFDHDLCLLVEYEESFTPQIVLEKGNPDAEGLLREDMLMVSYHPQLKEIAMATCGEYIFVVDRSGSMSGGRIESTKEALLLFLKSLPPDCYFNIVSFGSSYKSLFTMGSKKYSESTLKDAIKLQKSMRADMGGTELKEPLKHIYSKKLIPGHPRSIFLLTDGEVGNTEQVVSLVKKNVKSTRVFALGIGQGVSTSLIKGVTRAGCGKEEFITDEERMQPKVISLLKGAMQPAVTEVEIDWELPPGVTHMDIPTTAPSVITSGERITLFALLQGVDSFTVYAPSQVTIRGKMEQQDIKSQMTFTLSDEHEVSSSAPVHRLASKAQISILQDEEAQLTGGENNWYARMENDISDVRQKIVNLSRHANVVSRFTSFVAVETDGAKVTGTMESRPCPVPTLTPQFIQGFESQFIKNCCLDMDMDMADLGANSCSAGGLYDECDAVCDAGLMELRSPGPLLKAKQSAAPKSSMRRGFGCGLGNLFSRKKKKKTQYFAYAAPTARPDVIDGSMDDEADCMDQVDSGMTSACEKNDLERVCPEKKMDDEVMLEVVSLQEIHGSWNYSQNLATLLGMKNLKDQKIVPDQSVTCTLVVISWLRHNYSHLHDEWQMIETKAINWLSTQELDNKSLEDLLQEAEDLGKKLTSESE